MRTSDLRGATAVMVIVALALSGLISQPASAHTAPNAAPVARSATASGASDSASRAAAGIKKGRLGKARVLIMRIAWGTDPGLSDRDVQVTMGAKVRSYYREVSGGRFEPVIRATKPLRLRKPAVPPGLCILKMHEWLYAAQDKARQQGFNPDRFDVLVWVYPFCRAGGNTGTYQSAGRGIILQQPDPAQPQEEYDYDLWRGMVHELGHAWGLGHADALSCTTDGLPVTWSSTCRKIKYGDRFDQMGSNAWPAEAGWFNAAKLWALRWLAPSNIVSATSSRVVRLAPLAQRSSGARAVRIPGAAGRTYWVEYRTRLGQDSTLPEEGLGVQLRVDLTPGRDYVVPANPPPNWSFRTHRSYLLDPTPETDWRDVELAPGSSWTTPEGITITTQSVDPQSAVVQVTR